MHLGTAVWTEGLTERRALVAPLPGDETRLVDLNRVEGFRLGRLGEGQPEALAEVLVPSGLRRVLEGGPRALARLRTTLAYAEKWARRGDLPLALAPQRESVRLLPCLPRPAQVLRWDGQGLDRLAVQGPGAILGRYPQPTLALVGQRGGGPAGCCLALEGTEGVILGAWLVPDLPVEGHLELLLAGHRRRVTLACWEGLSLPQPRPGEVIMLPPPRLKVLPWSAGGTLEIRTPFETLALRLAEAPLHPIEQ